MLSISTFKSVSFVSTISLALAACGGMSETDLGDEGMDESAVSKTEDGESEASEGANDEARAGSSKAEEAQLADGADSASNGDEETGAEDAADEPEELIVDVDVTVTTTTNADDEDGDIEVNGQDVAADAADADEPAPTVIPEIPGPDILGSASELPIESTYVAAEEWVPPEGLAGVEQSGVELEVVDDLSVLVIFDNSGSMEAYWDGRTRWEAANQSLYAALAPVWTSLKVAAVRFPMETECGVPDFEAEAQFGWNVAGDFLDEWIANALAPVGGTPLGSAFIAADAAIAEASERGLLEERFNVLLITDGEPNCATEKALLTELPAKWLSMGVETHVLGLPGSEQAAQLLNAIAVAGGTAQPIAIETPEQLDEEVVHLAR